MDRKEPTQEPDHGSCIRSRLGGPLVVQDSVASPRPALSRESRERWKAKYMALKEQANASRTQARDLRDSRDHWEQKAKALVQNWLKSDVRTVKNVLWSCRPHQRLTAPPAPSSRLAPPPGQNSQSGSSSGDRASSLLLTGDRASSLLLTGDRSRSAPHRGPSSRSAPLRGPSFAVRSAPGAELPERPSNRLGVIHPDHFTETVYRHQYSVGQVTLTLQLVAGGQRVASGRRTRHADSPSSCSRTPSRRRTGRPGVGGCCAWDTTCCAVPRCIATDRAWMVDHSTQAGQERCLLILGHPTEQTCRRWSNACAWKDMEVIDLIPVEKSDKSDRVSTTVPTAKKNRVFPGPSSTTTAATWPAGWRCLKRSIRRLTVSTTSPTRRHACSRPGWKRTPIWKAFCTRAAQTKFADATDRVGFLGSSEPAHQSPLHEPR